MEELTGAETRTLSRRAVLTRALALGASVPAVALLAACGGDEDESTATAAAGQATATSGAGEATPTEAMADAMATETLAEPTATEAMAEPSPTSLEEVTPTAGEAGSEPNPRHYGYEISPAATTGGTLVRATATSLEGQSYFVYGSTPRIDGFMEALIEAHPETGEMMPLLAEAWEISDDLITWTMVIRPGVTFHNGAPLLASDVAFSFNLPDAIGISYFPLAGAVFSVIDDATVEFALAEPAAYGVLESIRWHPILHRDTLADLDIDTVTLEDAEAHPANLGTDPSLVVGTGPFRFTELGDDYLLLTRYDDYWDGRPNLDEYIIKYVPTQDATVAQLQTGELDVYGHFSDSLDPALVKQLDGTGIQTVQFPGNLYFMYMMNFDPEKSTLFLDVGVRQALLYAIDRQALVDSVLFGYGSVAHSNLALPEEYNIDDVPERYAYDPEQAATLLDAAGWVTGPDGVREKDGQRFSFTGWFHAGFSLHELTILAVQEYWRAVGIEMQPGALQSDAFGEKVTETFDYEMWFWQYPGQDVDDRFLWACEGDTNRNRYCNPAYDEVMAAWFEELDPERHRELRTEAVKLLMEDLPNSPLYWFDGIGAIRPGVHNYFPNMWTPGFNMETWWVEE